MLDLLSDPDKRRRMGAMGAEHVAKEQNWDRVVERMLPFLERTTPAGNQPG
jgi:hypothetical protein